MLALAGTAAGVAASLVGARLLREWLFGISPVDPLTLACSAGGFLCVAALATYLPARRAARIDPAITLRTE
jgi:ABC-type lipoprotein release transport system permease subunit